jgi:hypothetical protein
VTLAPSTLPSLTSPPQKTTKELAAETFGLLPSTKKCVSRRGFRIRLRNPKGTTIAAAVVKLNGKPVATRRGKRVTAPIDLRGLPKGTFVVKISILLSNGRTITGTRRYRTCAPRRRGGKPKI